MTFAPSFYEVLSVPTTCSSDDVRRAYHQMARRFHPDKRSTATDAAVTSEQHFLRVQAAYETLRHPELRRQYDAKLQQHTRRRKRQQEVVVVSDDVPLSAMHRVQLQDGDHDGDNDVVYTHECRCGDVYEVSEHELWDGVDVVPCAGCSLHVRVLVDTAQ
ncbi:unnamed protein product [Hyaloperonospora brassicae]|uniref:Diphthamide biosynthesis protein 4 n=1 Tax=Hyaloperonospora brassicae TaxID=162125 RepID=A0AAV0V138_HYABA|nr:unnamed protein product [Hyaloperonospora brassicae]